MNYKKIADIAFRKRDELDELDKKHNPIFRGMGQIVLEIIGAVFTEAANNEQSNVGKSDE